jgi:hypothetical protein
MSQIPIKGELCMNEELEQLLKRPTNSVPDVGRVLYGLSRNGSYDAAKRGDIHYIPVGKLLRVPTSWVRKVLGLDRAGEGPAT